MSHHNDKPCGQLINHPRVIANPPNLNQIAYRVGDFSTFRDALLRPLKEETQLAANWKPSPDDLGLQVIEWTAYLLEVLAFYGERWMQESFLRTAVQDEQVRRLVQLLGYRRRPAIASMGQLVADVSSPLTLPKGYSFQSKPGPGEEPQIFELDAETKLEPKSAILAQPSNLGSIDPTGATVWIRGTLSNVKVGDWLLLVPRNWSSDQKFSWSEVTAIEPEKDALGAPTTRIRFKAAPLRSQGLTGSATDFRLMRSTQVTQAWPYGENGTNGAIGGSTVHLAALVRDIRPGDFVLLDASQVRDRRLSNRPDIPFENVDIEAFGALAALTLPPRTSLYRVTSVYEKVWFANGQGDDPTKTPDDTRVPAVPIPHTVLELDSAIGGNQPGNFRHQIDFRHGWRDVGDVIAVPERSFNAASGNLIAIASSGFDPGFSGPVLLEGCNGKGSMASLVSLSAREAAVSQSVAKEPLTTPIKIWSTLISVSRGQTVEREVLGSGDTRLVGQEFVLQKKPLTYLPKADFEVGRLFTSTLSVWVDGVKWKEVLHFHGQADNARVYVTSEDDTGKTHVRFAGRLPTGLNNIIASYRFGGGAKDPEVGALSMILKPRDGLKAVYNPVKVGGGADAEPAEQLRRYAPRSVLAFDRAVSVEDYEAIALQAPSVTRARAYWTFDPSAQRGTVVVYVGDDAEAVGSARNAIRSAEDPNRPAVVKLAEPIGLRVRILLRVAYDRIPSDVSDAVRLTLLNSDSGLFGTQSVRIGKALFDSELSAACLNVPGVHGVKLVTFASLVTNANQLTTNFSTPLMSDNSLPLCAGHRRDPGEGKFFTFATEDLQIDTEVDRGT